MYTPTIILYYVHAHLDGGGWSLDLLKRGYSSFRIGVILNFSSLGTIIARRYMN
jgi:hypothetical protein